MAVLSVEAAPSVLRWARESIGISPQDAAKSLNIFSSDLGLYELGELSVPLATLENMADLYDRPLISFFLDTPPALAESLPDFRLLPENHGRAWPPELHKAHRRVLGEREILLDFVEMEAEAQPSEIDLRLDLDSDPEKSGERIRTWLNVDQVPETQRTPGQMLSFWSSLIEEKGILVTHVPGIPIDQMRGFSIGTFPFPAIALNSRDSARGRLFTLLHELVHILLRRGGICDLQDQYSGRNKSNESLERYCNAVAAAALMPKHVLLQDPIIAEAGPRTKWSGRDLIRLLTAMG